VTLPEYRVKARNTAESPENKIHDDAVARQYGFRGGLVPGVTVYAYLTHPLVAAFGAAWLERGTAAVRFVEPVLDGEELTVAGVAQRLGVSASVVYYWAECDYVPVRRGRGGRRYIRFTAEVEDACRRRIAASYRLPAQSKSKAEEIWKGVAV